MFLHQILKDELSCFHFNDFAPKLIAWYEKGDRHLKHSRGLLMAVFSKILECSLFSLRSRRRMATTPNMTTRLWTSSLPTIEQQYFVFSFSHYFITDAMWPSYFMSNAYHQPETSFLKKIGAKCKSNDFAPKSYDFAPNLPHQIITISHQFFFFYDFASNLLRFRTKFLL